MNPASISFNIYKDCSSENNFCVFKIYFRVPPSQYSSIR